MSDWFVDAHWNLATTDDFDGKDFPVFQNRTGHPIKIDTAHLAGSVASSATAYYVLTLNDDGGNTIVAKSLINTALTASGSLSMGSVDTTYQIIPDGNTVYINFTMGQSSSPSGAALYGLHLRLDGEILRGG